MNFFLKIITFYLFCSVSLQAEIAVASLHPLISDLAKNVGGDKIFIIEILKKVHNPHVFSPTPSDLVKLKKANIILASGKNFETYLKKINLKPSQKIYELGKTLPSCKVEVGELFICCPAHSSGSVDPHWWHSINNMERAARNLAKEFSILDFKNADYYKKNAENYRKKLKKLKSWAKREVSKVSRKNRKLVTAHAAFSYFCREFGFKSVPVQGLTHEKEPTAKYLAKTINIIKKEKIKAIFPENNTNQKILNQIAKETNVKIAQTLIADGIPHGNESLTYVQMVRYNIKIIVSALK